MIAKLIVLEQYTNLLDVRVAVLKSGLAKKDVRQRGEIRQIFILKTLAPRGINHDFSFIAKFLVYKH